MASKPMKTVCRDESFWRESPAMTGYFAPGIVPLLKYLELDSKQVMHEFGEQVGRKAAAKMANLPLDQMLDELAKVWQECEIGTLAVGSRNPIIIQISNAPCAASLMGLGRCSNAPFMRGFSRAP